MNQSRWLTLARVAWVMIAVFYFGAFIVALPIRFSEKSTFTSQEEGVTQEDYNNGLAQMGISASAYEAFKQWVDIVVGFYYLALGVFIFWRKSSDGMALLTALIFVTFLSGFDTLAQVNPWWQVVADNSAIVGTIITFLWFFIFPDGHFVPRWTRWIFLVILSTQIWRIFQPDVYQKSFVFLAPLVFGGILIAQISRYRHASAAQRQQIKWVVYGIVAGATPILLFFIYLVTFLNSQSALTRVIAVNFFGNGLWSLFVIELPLALTFAILRSRLFDIDVIIRRTLIYSTLTAMLALVFFGSVILLQQLFRALTNAGGDIAIIISTLAIYVLFNPLRKRIQDIIDRRFFRRKYDAQKVLAQFAQTARDETDIDRLTDELVRVVDETMQPSHMSLWLKATDGSSDRGKDQ